MMQKLLSLSKLIDSINTWVGKFAMWFVLFSVLVSAGNALVRKIFHTSSNAYLEIQWYFYAVVFLLGAGYTMLHQGHVRIDVILSRFSRRTQVKVEIFGIVCFLFPFAVSVMIEIMPTLLNAYRIQEMSENAGGLIRWPVYALIPIGFFFLALQGLSELIKRVGFLTGTSADPANVGEQKSAEEELAEEIRKQQMAQAAANKS